MDTLAWLRKNSASLEGKTVAITGATGGLGREICRCILYLKGDLILCSRSREKTKAMLRQLQREFPAQRAEFLPLDLLDMDSVKKACEELNRQGCDLLLHNAGIYDVPRIPCSTGLLNVFQVNFASPYYMTRQLLPMLEARHGRVTVVGSIAHTYAPTDPLDPDFKNHRCSSPLVYGNSKRYLMFAFAELMKDHPGADFTIGHPGITLTNISDHYPKGIFPLIRPFLKIFFPPPRKACRGIVLALTAQPRPLSWIGPRYFGIWGSPVSRRLTSCPPRERQQIHRTALALYEEMVR